jgi:hypothetical protein
MSLAGRLPADSDGIARRLFEMVLAGFAREIDAGRDRIIVSGAGRRGMASRAGPRRARG